MDVSSFRDADKEMEMENPEAIRSVHSCAYAYAYAYAFTDADADVSCRVPKYDPPPPPQQPPLFACPRAGAWAATLAAAGGFWVTYGVCKTAAVTVGLAAPLLIGAAAAGVTTTHGPVAGRSVALTGAVASAALQASLDQAATFGGATVGAAAGGAVLLGTTVLEFGARHASAATHEVLAVLRHRAARAMTDVEWSLRSDRQTGGLELPSSPSSLSSLLHSREQDVAESSKTESSPVATEPLHSREQDVAELSDDSPQTLDRDTCVDRVAGAGAGMKTKTKTRGNKDPTSVHA